MGQEHGDRLSATDAAFLAQEGPNAHMHIGAVALFEGPAPAYRDFANHIRSRLHLVPRYRQKLAFPPLETGRPLWVDDATFNLDYHVRHTALPAPGTEEQLRALVARIHSQGLDRSKPLWEMWLVQGLEDNRFALISKTHHALVDGISGVDLATVMFDFGPVPAPVPHEGEPWAPKPEPSAAQLAARGLVGLVRTPFALAGRAAEAIAHPQTTIDGAREAVEGVAEVAWAGLNPAPTSPLNVPIGPHRRIAFVPCELEDFKLVKNTFGGTVNDVVLTVVAGGLRRWLQSRGTRVEGLELRGLVPVSTRTNDQREDPVARLRVVRRAMDGLKESKQAVGAEVLTSLEQFAPPTILAQASRLNFSTRLFNLLVTNVPGPQLPLYVLGRKLQDLYPVAFLPRDHALAVAIMSYNGRLDFGLLADYDAMPDLDELAGFLGDSRDEIVAAARKAPGGGGAPKSNGKRPRARRTTATSRGS
jgi:diacylglycerol O-acyltransferase